MGSDERGYFGRGAAFHRYQDETGIAQGHGGIGFDGDGTGLEPLAPAFEAGELEAMRANLFRDAGTGEKHHVPLPKRKQPANEAADASSPGNDDPSAQRKIGAPAPSG